MKKAVIGIDVSFKTIHVCFLIRDKDNRLKVVASRTFQNSQEGADQMCTWVIKHNKYKLDVCYIMEATGCYYENLAYHLYEKGETVCVVLANKMKNYFKSLNIKTKTDKLDAKIIAQYGAERTVEPWAPISEELKTIRDICREILSHKKELNRSQNQLHAIRYSHMKAEMVKKIKLEQIEFHKRSIRLLREELKTQVKKDKVLKSKVDKLISIPGIGFETAIILVSETNGFKLFRNIRQVVSYAGLDVTHKESGNFKGRSKISKKGNSRIRHALYMPALSATLSNPSIKKLYERVIERNPNIKKKGVIASMRKLLVFCYVVWKKDEEFDKNYTWMTTSGKEETKLSFGQIKSGAMVAPH